MLKQNRSETDDLHRTIAAKDTELIAERNVLYQYYKLFFFIDKFYGLLREAAHG